MAEKQHCDQKLWRTIEALAPILFVAAMVLALPLITKPAPEETFSGNGWKITLVGAEPDRGNPAETKRKMQGLARQTLLWQKENLFDPFKVMVFPAHPVAREIRVGPSVRLKIDSFPDTAFWFPIKTKGRKILVENLQTQELKLVAPPQGAEADLTFANPERQTQP